jgi:hypothetical protein
MSRIKHAASTISIALASCGASVSMAAELPPEGKYDIQSCWTGQSNVIEFSKTHSASSYEFVGTTRSAVPGGFFDRTTVRCVGVNRAFDGKVSGSVVCETTDRDGHKALSTYEIGAGGGVRTFVVGTGKYEGMVMVPNPTKSLGPFPSVKPGTFQNCNHQTGTYKLMKKMN